MSSKQETWKSYVEKEMGALTPLLLKLGITLDEKQPHTLGERFLMQAVTTTSGVKLILLGKKGSDRVVIKATRDQAGMEEIAHERMSRKKIQNLDFAADAFLCP